MFDGCKDNNKKKSLNGSSHIYSFILLSFKTASFSKRDNKVNRFRIKYKYQRWVQDSNLRRENPNWLSRPAL